MLIPRTVALVAVLALACEGADPNSANTAISARPACDSCSIVLDRVVTLEPDSSSPRPDASGRDCLLAKSAAGRYLFSGSVTGGVIEIFDSTGTQVGTIGRAGSGPGEFGAIPRVIVGVGDTLFVIDDSNLRVQVLAADGSYVRSFAAPARYRSVALVGDSRMIFNVPPAAQTDTTFRALTLEGREVARFGRAMGPAAVEAGVVAPADGGKFWTARYWEYRLTRHQPNGEQDVEFSVDAEWFPPNAPFPSEPFKTQLPPSALFHIWQESPERIWTFTAAPDPEWTPGTAVDMSPTWYRKSFDTVIQIIDLQQRRVVASTRFPDRYSPVCGSNQIYRVVERDDGDTRLVVFTPRLQQGSPGR